MAYTKKTWKDYPDTSTQITADDLNNIEDGIEALDTSLSGGWISANETWTYASVDDPTGVITISGNVTTKYSLGMRIKFTNGGNVIYGIITAISYSSPNTTMTFLHEIDPTDSLALHLMASSAITNNYYSNVKAPYGFPLNPDKWSVKVIHTTQRSQVTTDTTIYNLGNISITLPVGLWEINYQMTGQIGSASSTVGGKYATFGLSTANNTLIGEYAVTMGNGDVKFIRQFANRTFLFTALSKTILYMNMQDAVGGNTIYFIIGANNPFNITAKCVYL